MKAIAFFDRKLTSSTSGVIAQAELEEVPSRVDALYKKACKGVHADVTLDEVRLVLISVYLLLAEIVRLAEEPARPQSASDSQAAEAAGDE